MNGKYHLLLGAMAGVVTASGISTGVSEQAVFLAACCTGTLFPDLDIPSSAIGRIARPVSCVVNKLFGHREAFHTPVTALSLSGCLYFLAWKLHYRYPMMLAGAFLLGFLLHLIQDTFTRGGIMWFWPIRIRIRFSKVSSDNNVFCMTTTILIFVFFLFLLFFIPYNDLTHLICN